MLAALVQKTLQLDPLSGHLFVYRRGGRLKIVYWDAQGYTLWYRRLEQETFQFPQPREWEASLSISATDLAMLLDGVELSSVKRAPPDAGVPEHASTCRDVGSRTRPKNLS